jgi:hypothetical protein
MRRCHLRGRENILKRQLVHVGAFNLSLVLRKLLGAGTPRELKNRAGRLFSRVQSFLRRIALPVLVEPLTAAAGEPIACCLPRRKFHRYSRLFSSSTTGC